MAEPGTASAPCTAPQPQPHAGPTPRTTHAFAVPLPSHTLWPHRNETRRLKRFTGASNQLVFAVQPASSAGTAWHRDAASRDATSRHYENRPRRQLVRLDQRWLNRTGTAVDPAFRAKARLLARLLLDCKLDRLYTLPTIQPLHVLIPDIYGTGRRRVDDEQAVLLEEAPGTSLASFRRLREPTSLPPIDPTSILDAAVFDTLINARDRSYENVFLTADGTLTLIDTLSGAFEYNAGPVDSVMVPASKLFNKRSTDPLQRLHWRLWNLDYRCSAHRTGLPMAVGRAYSPRLRRCLARVASGETFATEDRSCIVDCKPRRCRRAAPRFLRHGLACDACEEPGTASASTSDCCYSRASVCVPAELKARARLLLELGFEAVLSQLLAGSRWGGRGSTRFDNRTAAACEEPGTSAPSTLEVDHRTHT